MSLDLTDDKSKLGSVMAWCPQAAPLGMHHVSLNNMDVVFISSIYSYKVDF